MWHVQGLLSGNEVETRHALSVLGSQQSKNFTTTKDKYLNHACNQKPVTGNQ
jgi:hypothetical protein